MKRNPAPSFVSIQKLADLKSTPWKNGGGISSEIAIEPASAALGDANFLWRLSAAEISAPGPFSKFPGYDRLLALVRGKALELEFPQKSLTKKASLGQILAFSGDDEAQSKIPVGSVADLNLIFRRSEVRARMSLVEFPKSRPRSFELDAETVFFHGIRGPVSASVYPGEHKFRLNAGDTLRVDAREKEEHLVLLEPGDPADQLIAIEIDW